MRISMPLPRVGRRRSSADLLGKWCLPAPTPHEPARCLLRGRCPETRYGFKDVQRALLAGEISTVVPIEIARRNGHTEVRGELLLKTDVNMKEGIVYWHGLRLLVLDVSWLKRIDWVRKLRLARNGLKQLPDEIGTYLKQV